MNEYDFSFTKTFLLKVILIFFFLITGYIIYYKHQAYSTPPLSTLISKYSKERIDQHCQWSESSTYLSCFKRDYFQALRQASPYQRHLLFSLHTDIFNRNHYRHTTEKGRLLSYLDNQDLINNYLLINQNISPRRSQLDLYGFIYLYLNRREVTSYFHKSHEKLKKHAEKQKSEIEKDSNLKSRVRVLLNEAQRVSAQLIE